ncbi:penicillin-binding Tp47 domain A-containing protein [uncultured Ruminococcus sp.]|uniref:penicillin-binding Tp47 domain A-containing protein n=1 Tax=uncultured Ruminococcus sp. TaxID=165186 RepID=UPI0025E127DD|nr:penicillin-binding Tp47 domain A-containing protein [uncultured Ruminococcus sp.]
MQKKDWKKIAGALSAGVLAVTQVAPVMSVTAAEGTTDTEYVYCAASLTWAEYWQNEGVYLDSAANGNWEATSDEKDEHNETDMGAFDAVTRATSNHGLHRGSYQCTVKVFDTDGNSYDYTGKGQDESVDVVSDREAGTTTIMVDGKAAGAYDHSVIVGPKYVPVAVPAADYEDFKKAYSVYENGTEVRGGYSEKNLVNIDETIQVDANTSGIKVAEKNADGTFQFSKRSTSATPEGKVVDKDAVEISEVQHDSGYGDFIRVDINGDYGDLGAHMYAVRWDYYGDQDTVQATYGTKFAADNWMHKAMGIQLGLTKSDRCQLPEGTDGYGRWDVTVYATGYQDFTFTIDNEPEKYVYGTMNLPYADYYYGELGNKTDTTDGKISYDADLAGDAGMRAEGTYDAVTSATRKKWNSMFADTTYSSEADENGGGKILGVSGVEVAIEQSLYDQLTADAKDSKTSGVLGSLFAGFTPNEDQTVVPATYKQLFADGTLSATITAEPEVDLTNVTPTLKTDSKYGDYQLNMDGLDLGEGNLVYGVIVKTKTGNYGMLQLENIWKGGSKLAWSAGFKTTEVHGNSLRSTPYAATSGDTIVEISYLTSKGEYSVHLADGLYLPKKHNGTVTAESVAVAAGSIPVTLADLPEDFSAAVSADTLTGATYADGKMTFDAKSVLPGSYTITVSDTKGVYAPISVSVVLTTEAMPAAFDAENKTLVAAKDTDATAFANYLSKLSKATVNGTEYTLSGKGSTKIFDTKTGAIDLSVEAKGARVFDKAGTYEIKLSATGYTEDLTFTVELAASDIEAGLPTVKGDADLDGNITIDDAFLVLQYYSQHSAGNDSFRFNDNDAMEAQLLKLLDIDNNGEIGIQDAFLVLSYYSYQSAGKNVTWEDLTK